MPRISLHFSGYFATFTLTIGDWPVSSRGHESILPEEIRLPVRETPVIGAADHLSNNPIGPCTETRSICSAQITPPPRTFLDVSPRFYPDYVDNQQHSHSMT